MLPARLRLSSGYSRWLPLASTLCAASALLLPIGCTLPMAKLVEDGLPLQDPPPRMALSSLSFMPTISTSEASATGTKAGNASAIVRTSHHAGDVGGAMVGKEVVVDLDMVLRLAREHNPRIALARERVNESQAAFDAAVKSCMPEFLRKDTFKRANAEATLWERRAELSKVQNEVLQEAANTYFDWLTARRGEAIAGELQKYEEKLLDQLRKLVKSEEGARVFVETAQIALSGRRQFIAKLHQQGDSAADKLAYLLGMSDSVPVPIDQTLTPIDVVDAVVPVPLLVQQSLDSGPGVRELQGLAAAIQTGIDEAHCARRLCDRTGAAIVCGPLQTAQSKLQQAHLALADLRGKLRLGVEEARSAILSGREQIKQASSRIQHAAETYRLTNLRLESESLQESMTRKTYRDVLMSIQQLSQAHASYLSAVNDYNKAQVRLLLLLGTQSDCQISSMQKSECRMQN